MRTRITPHLKKTLVGVVLLGVGLPMTTLSLSGCAANPASPELVAPAVPMQPGTVLVVDQAAFDDLRNSGKYDISASMGTTGATAGCDSGSVDDKCVAAANERLKAAATEKNANLVLVLRSATLQSFPVQYSVTGELYRISNR